jgi:hypothetical protein
MSPLNECKRERDKLARRLERIEDTRVAARLRLELLVSQAARDRLVVTMYAGVFNEVLRSIREDMNNARTLVEARTWAEDIIQRFSPAFETDGMRDDADATFERIGVTFNPDNLRDKYEEIHTAMKEEWL